MEDKLNLGAYFYVVRVNTPFKLRCKKAETHELAKFCSIFPCVLPLSVCVNTPFKLRCKKAETHEWKTS